MLTTLSQSAGRFYPPDGVSQTYKNRVVVTPLRTNSKPRPRSSVNYRIHNKDYFQFWSLPRKPYKPKLQHQIYVPNLSIGSNFSHLSIMLKVSVVKCELLIGHTVSLAFARLPSSFSTFYPSCTSFDLRDFMCNPATGPLEPGEGGMMDKCEKFELDDKFGT